MGDGPLCRCDRSLILSLSFLVHWVSLQLPWSATTVIVATPCPSHSISSVDERSEYVGSAASRLSVILRPQPKEPFPRAGSLPPERDGFFAPLRMTEPAPPPKGDSITALDRLRTTRERSECDGFASRNSMVLHSIP